MISKLGIRADGGTDKGMGHIIRCLALAKEFINHNVEVTFITKYCDSISEILNKNNTRAIYIPETDLYDELNIIKGIIKTENLDTILIDSYWINDDYLIKIKENVSLLISIDDNNLYNYPSDIIINSNIYASDLKYNLLNKNSKLILGSQYAILRDEFLNVKNKEIHKNVENILITMGGTDINNFTPFILDSVKDFPYEFYVIIGSGFEYIDEIEKKYKNMNNIHFVYNPSRISEVMNKCDLAISSAGTTTYELGALGIPTILITQATNQINSAKKLNDLDIMINLGHFSYISSKDLKDCINKITKNYNKRLNMSNLSKKYISKDGVKKIIDNIIQYIERG